MVYYLNRETKHMQTVESRLIETVENRLVLQGSKVGKDMNEDVECSLLAGKDTRKNLTSLTPFHLEKAHPVTPSSKGRL